MRRGSEKLNTNALTAVPGFADKHDSAFLFFLRDWIFENEHFAVVDLVAESQQATMGVDDHGLANFTKFLAAMRTAMNMQPHLVEDTMTSARADVHCFLHAPILGASAIFVNCPKVQVSPDCNGSLAAQSTEYATVQEKASQEIRLKTCTAPTAGRRIREAVRQLHFEWLPFQGCNFYFKFCVSILAGLFVPEGLL